MLLITFDVVSFGAIRKTQQEMGWQKGHSQKGSQISRSAVGCSYEDGGITHTAAFVLVIPYSLMSESVGADKAGKVFFQRSSSDTPFYASLYQCFGQVIGERRQSFFVGAEMLRSLPTITKRCDYGL